MEQINPINKVTLKDKMKSYTRHPGSLILLLLVLIAAALTVVTLLFLVGYILISGIPYLKPSLFALHYNSDNVSMLPAIINTVEMVVVSLLFSVPFGVGAAIYMIEYARKGNKFVEVVRLTAETLTGIPSIIYGLFGMLFFNIALHWRYSMLSGAATLAIMVLPTIMRTTEEALLCVPDSYREGSFGWAPENCGRFLRLCFRRQSREFYPVSFSRSTYRRRDRGAHLHGGYRDRCGGTYGFRAYASPSICMCFLMKVYIKMKQMRLQWCCLSLSF